MENTKIQWADHTWNPWIGCATVHAGCKNCYAWAQAGRHGVVWGPAGTRRKTSDAYWLKPGVWDAKAHAEGTTYRVFPSLCDPFEDWDREVKDQWADRDTNMTDLRCRMFELIDRTPNLTWILLTKRPENIRRMWAGRGFYEDWSTSKHGPQLIRDNVWLVYSASDQESLENGLPHLLECRDLAPVLGLSLEPLIGPVTFRWAKWCPIPANAQSGVTNELDGLRMVDWVIVGGESGRNARPCNIEWIRSIVEQCRSAGVPCFAKQLGEKPYMDGSGGERFGWPCGYTVTGGKTWLDLMDKKGGNPDEWPDGIQVREFPA